MTYRGRFLEKGEEGEQYRCARRGGWKVTRRAVTERECRQAVDRQQLAIGGMELTALR